MLHAVPVQYSTVLNAFKYRHPIQWFDSAPTYMCSNTFDVGSLFRLGSGPVFVESDSVHPFPGAEANAHLFPLITSVLSTTGSIPGIRCE